MSVKKSKQPKIKAFKVKDLTRADTNVRMEYPEEAMNILRSSITQLGLLELPKCTTDGKVFAGWGRVEACKQEGYEDIYCIVIDDMDDTEQILASLAENYARSNLYDDEVRYTLKRLRDDMGLTGTEIARRTGMNDALVYTLLDFYRLPETLQEEVKELAEEGERIPVYTMAKITEIVQALPKDEQEEVGKKMIEIATARSPLGKKITRPIIQEIAEQAKLGRAGPTELDKILAAARRTEYMTITLSVPDECYMPFFKYAKGNSVTIHEAIVEAMMAYMPVVDKYLKGK